MVPHDTMQMSCVGAALCLYMFSKRVHVVVFKLKGCMVYGRCPRTVYTATVVALLSFAMAVACSLLKIKIKRWRPAWTKSRVASAWLARHAFRDGFVSCIKLKGPPSSFRLEHHSEGVRKLQSANYVRNREVYAQRRTVA